MGEISQPEASRRLARPAAQRAAGLKDKHKFTTEMDDEARRAMFRHMSEKVA
jgi:GSH-dependent disulfide-bond oxidoreductase